MKDIYREALGELADSIERNAVLAVEDYHAIATGKLRSGIHVKLEGMDTGNPQIVCYAEGDGGMVTATVGAGPCACPNVPARMCKGQAHGPAPTEGDYP